MKFKVRFYVYYVNGGLTMLETKVNSLEGEAPSNETCLALINEELMSGTKGWFVPCVDYKFRDDNAVRTLDEASGIARLVALDKITSITVYSIAPYEGE